MPAHRSNVVSINPAYLLSNTKQNACMTSGSASSSACETYAGMMTKPVDASAAGARRLAPTEVAR